MYYQRLTTKTKASPVKVTMFLEKERFMPEHSLYVPTTPTYWENHKEVYRNVTNPQDVEARKHGWCDFVVRNNRFETYQYYKFFTRGDSISLGMIEKWKGLSNNHQVVIFDQQGLGYVTLSMDWFSQNYEMLTTHETMELRMLNCFIPEHIGEKYLSKYNFNNITHSKVLNIIEHTEILPHEYLKYHKSTKGYKYIFNKCTFYSLKCLYDFLKPADISYERFRHVYSSFGVVKELAKEVSSFGSPSGRSNEQPIKCNDEEKNTKLGTIAIDGLSGSEAPREQMTNANNSSKAREHPDSDVSVDDKRSGHALDDITRYYKVRAEVNNQLLNVLDRDYVEDITRKADFYDCYTNQRNYL